MQKGKPDKWKEKEGKVDKVSIDEGLHVSEIRLPSWGGYNLIITVDKEFDTELKEEADETELLIKKP